MENLSEEEDRFFDPFEDVTSVSDSSSDCPENLDFERGVVDSLSGIIGYEVWKKNPGSRSERRNEFLKWMGFSVDQAVRGDAGNMSHHHDEELDADRIAEHSGAVLGSSFDDGFSSSQSSMSCWSSDAQGFSDGALEENFVYRIRNLDNGMEFIVDEVEQDGIMGSIRELSSNRLLTIDEFERRLGLSPLVQQLKRKEIHEVPNLGAKQRKMGWLRRLGAAACIIDRQVEGCGINYNNSYPVAGARTQKIKVRSYKKRLKELSALYMRQDIPAHEGSILTMKFSPDGQYLASAGEDGVVHVWQVMESERPHEFGVVDIDSSHVYYTVNNFSELVPSQADRKKKSKFKSLPTSKSACVIFPQKVFQISEKPIHEFYGHRGEVLDLSWSNKKHLLSSSVDKTVRLWQVGCIDCLKVFVHNDYVTCIQFNPVDDNYFISGSIDGKVRIWEILGCQVVDWTDITEIVTAVCYFPAGKGVIVGSMTGNCRFYDASDNRPQLYTQVCLQGKKKSSCKRITGFQFSPNDPTRLMVASADSQIRLLQGVDVICRFRGIHNAGSQISASFTSDGMHIVSASQDSNVYIWNYINQDGPPPQVKNNWSCEHFFSNNMSVAIPWCGMVNGSFAASDASGPYQSSVNLGQYGDGMLQQSDSSESSQYRMPFSSPAQFPPSQGLFSTSLTKGSTTWPEEMLPSNSLAVSSAMCKSQYKFLKTSCDSIRGSHHTWGLVIVTGGWDGRIRIFQNYGLPVRA